MTVSVLSIPELWNTTYHAGVLQGLHESVQVRHSAKCRKCHICRVWRDSCYYHSFEFYRPELGAWHSNGQIDLSSPSREAHGRPALQVRQFRNKAENCILQSNPASMSGRDAHMHRRERGQETRGSDAQVPISWALWLVFKHPSLGFSPSPAIFQVCDPGRLT